MKPTRLNKLICIIVATMASHVCGAYEFKIGTYYFDNSKTKFSSVRFVAGNNADTCTMVLEMNPVDGRQWWKFSLSKKLSGIDHYCFIDSDMPSDTFAMVPRQYVDSLSLALGDEFKSTLLFGVDSNIWGNNYDGNNYPSWVFCPSFKIPNTNGYWRPIDSYDATPSGTLPLVYINTEDSLDIVSKEDYINAYLWINNCGIEGYESLGSEEAPLDIEIKGRGNYSWFYSYKKPYRIKFSKKQKPIGLNKSKHFILRPNSLDYTGYLKNETGFELSRQMGLPYTTRELPVELILNGEYVGLYFLCEKIRVEEGRVEITEQNDYETDPEKITGGWLLENRATSNIVHSQFENNDPSLAWISFESHSPENCSPLQINYISTLLSKTDSCIHVTNKDDQGWEQYIDINSLARFYIIHEVMDNVEAFNASLFMYKDFGENEKFHFGPVWDFDNSFTTGTTQDQFVYNYTFFPVMWMREIVKFPRFQQEIRDVWKEFRDRDILAKVHAHALQWRETILNAEIADKVRWRGYGSAHPENAPTDFLNTLSRKVAWLDEQWHNFVLPGDVNADGRVNVSDVTALVNMILRIEPTNFDTADVNGDRRVNTSDLTALINIILGIH